MKKKKKREAFDADDKGKSQDSPPISQKAQSVINAYRSNAMNVPSDVMGSYTGIPDEMDQPIQDVDDM